MKLGRRSFLKRMSAGIAAFTIGVSVAFPSTKKLEVKEPQPECCCDTPCMDLLDRHMAEGIGPWEDWDTNDHHTWLHATPEFIAELEWEIQQISNSTPWRKFDGWKNPSRVMFNGRPFKPYEPNFAQVETNDGSEQYQESRPAYFYEFVDGWANLNSWHDVWVRASYNLICRSPRVQGRIVAAT